MIKKIISSSPILYFLILPFIFWPQFPDPYELPKFLIFILSINIITGLYFWGILTQNLPKVKKNKIFPLLLAFLLILFLSSLLNGLPAVSLLGQYYRYQGLITYLGYLLFFLLFSHLQTTSLKPESLGKIIGLGGLLVAAAIILQGIALKIFHLPVYHYNGRLTGFFGNPNFAAGFLSLSFVYHAYSPLPRLNKKITWPLFFLAVWLTGSRSGLLAFLVGTFLSCLKPNKKTLGLALIGLVLLCLTLIPTRAISPFENRPLIWQKAIQAGLKKPLFGWGPDNFAAAFQSVLTSQDFDLKNIRVDKAHNEILEVFVASGFVGLGVYLLILKETCQALWRRREELWPKTNFIALTTYFLLGQLNVLNINESLFFYLILSTSL